MLSLPVCRRKGVPFRARRDAVHLLEELVECRVRLGIV